MMFGGGMMLGLGLLMMLMVFGLPILFISAIGAGLWGLIGRRAGPMPATQLPSPARYCSHCGQGLQTDWTHCPNCGASIIA